MYESTMDIFYNLWNLLAVGGWMIIDDYEIPPCKTAVHEFLDRHGVKVRSMQAFGVQSTQGQSSFQPRHD